MYSCVPAIPFAPNIFFPWNLTNVVLGQGVQHLKDTTLVIYSMDRFTKFLYVVYLSVALWLMILII